jgi:hypothetical protein
MTNSNVNLSIEMASTVSEGKWPSDRRPHPRAVNALHIMAIQNKVSAGEGKNMT